MLHLREETSVIFINSGVHSATYRVYLKPNKPEDQSLRYHVLVIVQRRIRRMKRGRRGTRYAASDWSANRDRACEFKKAHNAVLRVGFVHSTHVC